MTSGCDAFFGRAQCYVDGAWSTPSGDPVAVVIDPFTEQPIGEVAEAVGPLVEKAILAATRAQAAWAAEVYSADRDHAERFARRLDCGQVKINGVRTRDHPDVPFGGIKLSGCGRELGALGLA